LSCASKFYVALVNDKLCRPACGDGWLLLEADKNAVVVLYSAQMST